MTLDCLYQGHGISFRYPEGWELSEEPRDDALTITVSDAGPFWSVTVLSRRPRSKHVLEQACKAFHEEYDEVDDYPATARLAGRDVPARNLEFVSLELINCVMLRACEVGGRTLFVMAQVTDHERADYEQIFEWISESLTCDDDGQIMIG